MSRDVPYFGPFLSSHMKTTDVCVVGSGPTGVCIVKYCLEYGLSVICYDERPTLGGIWLGSDPSFSGENDDGDTLTTVHDELRLNTSQFVTVYSDFPLPDDITPCFQTGERFQNAAQFLEYLKRYAANFGADKCMQHSTTVVNVKKEEDSDFPSHSWQVTTKVKRDGSFVFNKSRHRYVIIASGFYRKPVMPEIPGMVESKMKIIHSGHCRYSRQLFEGRRVLVMGGSLSAGDIVNTALRAGASKVTWALTRNPTKRSILGLERQPFGRHFAWDEWVTLFGALYFPEYLRRRMMFRFMSFVHRRATDAPMNLEQDRVVVENSSFVKECRDRGLLTVVTGTVSGFEPGSTARLTTGERVEADVCVVGTGYKPSYPFLDVDVASLPLYRNCVVTDRHLWGLAFLYTTSFAGGGIACEEMEARWLLHHLSRGDWESDDARRRMEGSDDVFYTLQPTTGIRRVSVDLIVGLAREMGCLPPLWPAIISPSPWMRRRALAAAIGPLTMHLFRMRGPNARSEMAEVVLRQARMIWGWKFDLMTIVIDLLHVGAASTLLVAAYRFFVI